MQLLPFLPSDNDLTSQSHAAVSQANAALGRLLCLPFSEFASQVLHDAAVIDFLDSFLRHRRRPHEQELQLKLGKPAAATESQALVQLTRRVLAVLLRLTTSDEGTDSSAFRKELSECILLQVPAIMDACAIYGESNRELLGNMLNALMEQLPDWERNLKSTASSVAAVLQEVHAQAITSDNSHDTAHMCDLAVYLVDISASLLSLLKCGGAAVAAVLQDVSGELMSDGICTAVALTYEATLTRLEDAIGRDLSQADPENTGNMIKDSAPDVTRRAMLTKGRQACTISQRNLLQFTYTLLDLLYLDCLASHVTINVDVTTDVSEGLLTFVLGMASATQGVSDESDVGSLLGSVAGYQSIVSRLKSLSGCTIGNDIVFEEDRCDYICQVLSDLPQLTRRKPAKTITTASNSSTGTIAHSNAILNNNGNNSTQQQQQQQQYYQQHYSAEFPPDTQTIARMVKEVQDIFGSPSDPNNTGTAVGTAYVEACLSLMNWSPQAVAAALASGNEADIPHQLRGVPRTLGKAWRGKQSSNENGYSVDKEAAQRAKALLKAKEREEELDAMAFIRETREYDDDYDDQYDDMQVGVTTGGSDALVDQEAVRRFNKVYREEESDIQYWDTVKNTNRNSSNLNRNNNNDDDSDADEHADEPDCSNTNSVTARTANNKVGKGRVHGNSNSSAATGSTSQQQQRGKERSGKEQSAEDGEQARNVAPSWLAKHRKDQKKAIVGNHNRKQGAAKKAARAMF